MLDYPCGWDGPAGFRTVQLPQGVWVPVVEANGRRVALLIGSSADGRIALAFDSQGTFTTGVTLNSTADPLVLSRHLHGGLVTRSWWAINNGAIASSLSVMEAFSDK